MINLFRCTYTNAKTEKVEIWLRYILDGESMYPFMIRIWTLNEIDVLAGSVIIEQVELINDGIIINTLHV